MTALIVIAVILALFVVLALLRFGASFEYSQDGLRLVCILGPVRIRLIPPKDRKKPKKTEKKKKSGKSPVKPPMKNRKKVRKRRKSRGQLRRLRLCFPLR